VRGRFLLKFSCTNVKLETVSPIAANDLQISEGTNSVGFSGGIWAFAYLLL